MSGGFLAIGVYAVVMSIRMQYYVDGGPGPGFFPLWLGLIMVGCAIAVIVPNLRRPDNRDDAHPDDGEGESFLPGRASMLRGLGTLVAIGVFAMIADDIGFQLSMFALLLFLTAVICRAGWKIALTAALVGGFGAYLFFQGALGIYLPLATIPFLAGLGL